MILTLDGQTSKRNLQLMKADIHKFQIEMEKYGKNLWQIFLIDQPIQFGSKKKTTYIVIKINYHM